MSVHECMGVDVYMCMSVTDGVRVVSMYMYGRCVYRCVSVLVMALFIPAGDMFII